MTNCHFSTEKLSCDYYTSIKYQCVLIFAPEFHILFSDYSQVPLNCNQLLTVILTQSRLFSTNNASTVTKNFMCASAQILSHQMTVSTR